MLQNQQIEIDEEIEFEWKIDEEMLKEWKIAEPEKSFYSKTFGIAGNWCLWIAPNGKTQEKKGQVRLAAHLLRVNDGSKYNVVCKYKLMMICDGEEI